MARALIKISPNQVEIEDGSIRSAMDHSYSIFLEEKINGHLIIWVLNALEQLTLEEDLF